MILAWSLIFAEPSRLLLLLAIPLLLALYAWTQGQLDRRMKSLGDPALIRRISPENSVFKQRVKFSLVCLAIVCLIADLAKPELVYRRSVTKALDVAVALDVSKSMLAKESGTSRLELARKAIHAYLDNLSGARFSLVPFAGQARVSFPLSSDKKTFSIFLDQTGPGHIPVQGTDIASALRAAMASLPQRQDRTRFVIVLSDGENHEQGAMEEALKLKSAGTKLIVVGIGGTAGQHIPLPDGSYKKDAGGKIILTRFHPEFLDSISKAAGGWFFQLDKNEINEPVNQVDRILSRLPPTFREEVQKLDIHFFIALALLLLIFDFITFESRGAWLSGFRETAGSFFSRRRVKLLLLHLLFSCIALTANAQAFYGPARKGLAAYQAGNYNLAASKFRENLLAESKNPSLLYDLGTSLCRQGYFSEAASCFKQVLQLPGRDRIHQQSLFNLAYVEIKNKQYEQAIQALENYLAKIPQDHDGLYNLAYARYLLKKSRQNPPPPPARSPPPPVSRSQSNSSEKKKEARANELKNGPSGNKLKQQNLNKDW